MTVARFMDLALYHPEYGYYTAGPARTGWRGHFLTSPEIDPAFGEIWARGFAQVWEACDRPSRFVIIEIGPGEGGFAASVLAAVSDELASCLSYVLVERSNTLRDRQAGRLAHFEQVTWSESLEGVSGDAGCVFANEVLDNVPVHVVEGRRGRVMEVLIEAGRDGLEQTLGLPSPDVEAWLERHGIDILPGHRVEVGLASDALATTAAGAIDRGAIVFCDYGLTVDELEMRPAGTIACYSETGVDDAILDRPGHKDITTHANWTSIEAALRGAGLDPRPVMSQRVALKRLGLDEMHADLRVASSERGGIDAVRALSRRQALGVLADPSGLGGLGVLAAVKRIDPPAFLAPN